MERVLWIAQHPKLGDIEASFLFDFFGDPHRLHRVHHFEHDESGAEGPRGAERPTLARVSRRVVSFSVFAIAIHLA